MSKTATAMIERATDRENEFWVRRGGVRFLRVPMHRFAMVDAAGPPLPETFETRMPGLYTIAYGLRFALKRRGVEGRVGPLEGLWRHEGHATDLDAILGDDRAAWRWTLMIVVPDEATDDEIEPLLAEARSKVDTAIANSLRVEPFEEGEAAQVLHVGPYAAERPSIERLHDGIIDAGFRPTGPHHEIYVGDPGRSAPEKLRTVLRRQIER
jgi:hypothetical protein